MQGYSKQYQEILKTLNEIEVTQTSYLIARFILYLIGFVVIGFGLYVIHKLLFSDAWVGDTETKNERGDGGGGNKRCNKIK